MPYIPFFKKHANRSEFYGPDEDIPVFVAILMGVQHFLGCVGGLITPTLLISGTGATALNLDAETRSYMIAASFIVSGITSLVYTSRFRVPRTRYYVGVGLLEVAGVAFSALPAAQAMVENMYIDGTCQTETLSDGTINYLPCPDGFGAILGTQIIGSILSIIFSFVSPRILKRLFPKIVTGIVLFCIGAKLITSSMKNWAGGSGPCMQMPDDGLFALCPNINAPNPQPWGGPVNFALGASVFFTILLIELLGSVFLKNVSVVIGLIVGCIIAAGIGMFDSSSIDAAPAGTFLWVKTFKLSIYGPGVIPVLFSQLAIIIDSIGEITAVCDVSQKAIEGDEFQSRIQGGLLTDGLLGIFSGLGTTMSTVLFTQNNGIIAVTRCASRIAGFVCAGILILCGILGKFSATFLAIPEPLIGGMTVYLFASVATSGLRILAYLEWTRRDRVIIASSLAIGLGVLLVPNWFKFVLPTVENAALNGFYSAIRTVVSTSNIIGGIMAVLLNLILPYEEEESADQTSSAESEAKPMGGAHRMYYDEEQQQQQEAITQKN
ncbi:permease family-domain-containing protein [Zychaea mexicana]|uniref:permease family-domain-containing protein n=1 Tax=Zychaea mexicana TaxID=64656 RepID=UPI0022FDD6F1|nr:permease family-domain-containing protein [Zychaea mexicana]KAI9490206.1 permease family-domain-containing protein [Zychaea mexicana]